MSDSSSKISGEKKPLVNSLLNAFVPDDLVTFPMPAPHPVPLLEPEATSEIDLGGEEDEILSLQSVEENLVENPTNMLSQPSISPITEVGNSKPEISETSLAGPSHFLPAAGPSYTNPIFPGVTVRSDPQPLELQPPVYALPVAEQVPSFYAPPPMYRSASFSSDSNPLVPTPPLNVYSSPPASFSEFDGNADSVAQAPPLPYVPAMTSGNNSFRMGSQKLAYAKYPGLSSTEAITTSTQFQPQSLPPAQHLQYPSAPPLPVQMPSLVPDPSASTFTADASATSYKPASSHWFYRKIGEVWKPFSHLDSKALEEGFRSSSKKLVSVDGGRMDVDLEQRVRKPVYWKDTDVTHVQRCLWFYKGPMDSQYMPYNEEFSNKLEAEYELSCLTNTWHKRLEFSGGEAVVLQGPNTFVHFCPQASADEWGSVPENQLRPRLVKRGMDGLNVPPAEPVDIDYLVFLVHGIGSVCDFKFRSVVETVDDFRKISNQLVQTHFKDIAGRVEFLPVQWHKALHGDGGIDDKLRPITLKSIPKLRHFTNDTLLDILFYTSPVYCQTIMNTVGNEMNRMYNLFLDRNPTFNCLSVAVAGHSLGSLILFDLLSHQPEMVPTVNPNDLETDGISSANNSAGVAAGEIGNRMVSYRIGSAGTGQPFISYPVLDFQPTAFFAMGSPIAMFVAVRGLDGLGEDFRFPTCPAFFNIFHPFDPVAYRMENLIDPTLDLRPILVPHHKGRKRFHLELKETMTRVGMDIKNRVMESIRVTYKAVTQLTGMAEVEQEVDEAIATELNAPPEDEPTDGDKNRRVGSLNSGRRIDYVLQEAPHQILNEYLFALSSHVCYWESEDTVLLILNEILNEGRSVSSRSTSSTPEPTMPDTSSTQTFSFPTLDSQEMFYTASFPQSNTSVPIPTTSFPSYNQQVPPPPTPGSSYTTGKRPVTADLASVAPGMDPTAPLSNPSQIAPPPKSGFQPKNH